MREILSLVTMISPKFPRKTQDMGRNDTTREALLSTAGRGFRREGGLGKVHQVFGSELSQIIEELNGALAA